MEVKHTVQFCRVMNSACIPGQRAMCVYLAQFCRLLPDETLVCTVLSLVYETHLPAFCRPCFILSEAKNTNSPLKCFAVNSKCLRKASQNCWIGKHVSELAFIGVT